MDIPLLMGPDSGGSAQTPPALAFTIGADGARRLGAALPTAATTLRAGEGMVATTTARGQPAVIVLGADAAGTMAAAELLAGRLPHVWDPKGPTLEQIAADVKKLLADGGVAAATVSIPGVSVTAGQDEIRVVNVAVGVQNAAETAKAAGVSAAWHR